MWAVFLALVSVSLYMDLAWGRHHRQALTFRQAALWSVFWVVLSLFFCGGIYLFLSPAKAGEFLAGYLIEKSLSVDNLFIFLMIFRFFDVDPAHQPRVLKWGILGARQFSWVFYIFGAVVLWSAYKMAFGKDRPFNPEETLWFRRLRGLFPLTGFTEDRFFVRQAGRLFATPLFLTVVVVEVSDLIFALDSIPAIFSITTDPFIVFSSNVLAILGLRALYFLVQSLMGLFVYLKQGVSLILAFVGVKMVIMEWVHIDIKVSLAVVAGVLGGSILLSAAARKKA
jgi:tellurite resistance protein TerC